LKLADAPNIQLIRSYAIVAKLVSVTCDRAEFNGERKLGLIELCRSLLKILIGHRPGLLEIRSFVAIKEEFDADYAEIEAFMKANYSAGDKN
jgi:hypothetical protein